MADQPLPRIVSTPDTCNGALRFEHTRLTIVTFMGLVILSDYTEEDLRRGWGDEFPIGGVEALRQHYAANQEQWDSAWAAERERNDHADCCLCCGALRELMAAQSAWDDRQDFRRGPIPNDPTGLPEFIRLRAAYKRAEAAVGEQDG